MTASEDVKTLFRRFGGEPDSYQEVGKERAVGQALGKWAMLGQVDINHPQSVSSVRRAVKTADTRPLSEGADLAPPEAVAPSTPAPAATTVTPAEMPIEVSHRTPEVAVKAQTEAPQAQPLGRLADRKVFKEPAPPASPQNRTSPLAARFRDQAVAPTPAPEARGGNSHSLTGLFGRLSAPASPAPQTGVLRRKFNK